MTDPTHPAPIPTAAATLLWGRHDLGVAFTGDRRVVPWRSAPRFKNRPLVPPDDQARLLAGPPALTDLDPRLMHATQTWCVASHVAYYLSPEWAQTGRTACDREKAHNRYPLVWLDTFGRQILLGGHHRSLAALLEGRPVRCRVLRPDSDRSAALLPLLLVGPSTRVDHIATDDPKKAASAIRTVRTALVSDLDIGRATLEVLGFSAELIADRIAMATSGRTEMAA